MKSFKMKLYEEYKEYNEKINKLVMPKKKPPYYKMYDEDKQYIGWINMKYEKMQNRFLKGVSTFVITREGNVIIEVRSKDCNLTPSKKDLCSGHIDMEEGNDETVYRELQEELGIKKEQIDIFSKCNTDIPLIFSGNRKFFIQFNTIIGDFKLQDIKQHLQKEELSDVIEIPLEECFELIRNGKTKFPYKGHEKQFEDVFQSVVQIYQKYKEDIIR